jgi:DNA-binding MarR family transcriptional regulator
MNRKPNTATAKGLPEEQLFVAIMKTADALSNEAEPIIKDAGLTSAQYNVLRILRGAGADGLPCRAIGERMISHDPDMTRMLDRMEKRELITRSRGQEDRRVVTTRITPEGLQLLKKLDQPIQDFHKQRFRHMSSAQLQQLKGLLEQIGMRESC